MSVKRQVLKEDIGKFGKIVAGEKQFEKSFYGRVLYVDRFGTVIIVDNDDIIHRFAINLVREFTEEEFKPISNENKLPTENKNYSIRRT